jgi:hypothetical protein
LIHTHGNPSAAHGWTSWKSDAATWMCRDRSAWVCWKNDSVTERRLIRADVGRHRAGRPAPDRGERR